MSGLIGFMIFIVLIAIVGFFLVGMYNTLVRARNEVKNAWSQIDVQLNRRHDLIPNLVETVKGYMTHERETLEAVTAARQQAVNITGDVEAKARAENQLSQTLRSLFAVSEAYPDLKANQNFLELQRELTDTEDKVMAARRFFNGGVRELNTKIQQFPTNVFARSLGFTSREFFEVENPAAIQEPPAVKF